jgi:polyferredoxin
MKHRKTGTQRIRLVIQILFFVIIAATTLAHTLEEQGIVIPWFLGASIHSICPFGGVVTLYRLITEGTYVQKIHESAVWLMGIVLVSTVLVGPAFCGWVCPFGSFQEWIGKLGRKLFKRRYNHFVPASVDRVLRYLRYVVLIWVVVMTATTATLIFADYDPYNALFNFYTGEVAITGYIALGLVMVLSLFVERPFCKYACPYGAMLGVANLFRVFKLRRNTQTCIDCKACDKSCPMNIPVSTSRVVKDHQCNACMQCTSDHACPVAHTVEFNTKALEHKSEEASV